MSDVADDPTPEGTTSETDPEVVEERVKEIQEEEHERLAGSNDDEGADESS